MPAGQDQVGFGGKYGYYQDPTGLYLLGSRYYDPTNGRFLTRDPIGYQAGPNLYAYCRDNPITRCDPKGTQDEVPEPAGERDSEEVALDKVFEESNREWNEEQAKDRALGEKIREALAPKPPPPPGFRSQEEFDKFVRDTRAGFEKIRGVGVPIYLRGSAVTGVGYESGLPFNDKSDYDLAIVDSDLLDKIKSDRGGMPNNGRSYPLKNSQLRRYGMFELQRKLSEEAGRKVTVMIYRNDSDVYKRDGDPLRL